MCHTKVNKSHRFCTTPARQLARISAPAHARDLAWEVAFPTNERRSLDIYGPTRRIAIRGPPEGPFEKVWQHSTGGD